jgi:hypothetical protein
MFTTFIASRSICSVVVARYWGVIARLTANASSTTMVAIPATTHHLRRMPRPNSAKVAVMGPS